MGFRIYSRFKKGLSIRKCYLLAICIVSFYLVSLIRLQFNEENRLKSPITQANKSITINNSHSWVNKTGKFFTGNGSGSGNYFQQSSRVLALPRLVDTRNCKIPDFDVFDQDALPFIISSYSLPEYKCNETQYNWSRVYKNKLIINRNQVELDGYSLYKGFCCYKVVERVTLTEDEQKTESKVKNGDNLIKYSSCIDINAEVTELKHEFIVVECGWMKFIPAFVAYRAFHGSAVVQGSQKSENVEKKINYWKSQSEDERLPPNILIIGLDTTSRLNFRRNMFKTLKFLEELEAVEMMGYTKVGENTFPNWVPLMTGYSEEDLVQICYESSETPQDSCPNIWKRFDFANYITALSEDSPFITAFNYMKTGFVNQPVDYYLRPLIQSAHDFGSPPFYHIRKDYMHCIGQQTNDEAILSYVESVLERGHTNKTPVYSISWSSYGSHGDLNYLQLVDNLYATFLKRILDKGYLENTILIFMGDHGYRYGPFRETILGYYEDKLPNMWIALPPWIREEFPEWQTSLEINSRMLTSPFTMYWTLNEVLEMFSSLDPPKAATNSKTGEVIKRKHVQTFFEAVPKDNTCADVGVPETYCACYLPQKILLHNPLLNEAAVTALNAKNRELFSNCSPLRVKSITAGTVLEKSGDIKRVVVGFTAEPGDFLLEAEIDYFTKNETFSNQTNVHRTSKINPDYIRCISDSVMELFCYCTV